jgi:hypothetical protein
VGRRLFTVRYKILIYPNNLFFLYLHFSNVTLLFRRPLPLWRLRRRDKMPASLGETSWRSIGPVFGSITFTTRAVTLLRCKSFEPTSLVVAAAEQEIAGRIKVVLVPRASSSRLVCRAGSLDTALAPISSPSPQLSISRLYFTVF